MPDNAKKASFWTRVRSAFGYRRQNLERLANAIVERTTLNRTRSEGIGIFYQTSHGNINWPVGLGDTVEQAIVSGIHRESVKTDAAGTTILQDRFYSTGAIDSVPLLNGSTGPSTWKSSGRNVVFDFDPFTGVTISQIMTKIFFENLAVKPVVPFAQGEGTVLGDPLVFVEVVTSQFFPAGPLPVVDNCPDDANPGQEDSDLDGNGDACDGLIWLDSNCNGTVDARDTLRTLSGVANVAVTPAPNCPAQGAPWGQRTGGDWNCDTFLDASDILYGLKAFAGIPDPVPSGCPSPGELVPE